MYYIGIYGDYENITDIYVLDNPGEALRFMIKCPFITVFLGVKFI